MALRFLKAPLGAALVLGAQAALAQQPAPAGDAGLAHRHKTAMCIGCHGIPGYKTAFPEVYHVPKIAGQQPGYIIAALKAYKSGERSHPSAVSPESRVRSPPGAAKPLAPGPWRLGLRCGCGRG